MATLTTNSEAEPDNGNRLQYKVVRVTETWETDQRDVVNNRNQHFELCVQKIERQVQAAIEEGFVPIGSLCHTSAHTGYVSVFHMTQSMVRNNE